VKDEKSSKAKVTVFYEVLHSIGNNQWCEFARDETYLNLAQSDIDNIQHDYQHNIEEQKFQMILQWAQPYGKEIKSKSKNLCYTRLIPFRVSRVSGVPISAALRQGPYNQGCNGGESLATYGKFD